MRWSFHKRRDRRYQIALEELKKTYREFGGYQIETFALQQKDQRFSRLERFLIKNLKRIESCFVPYSPDFKKKHANFLKYLRKGLRSIEKLEPTKSWHEQVQNLILELCKTKFYRIHLFLFGHHLLQDLFSSLIHKQESKKIDFDHHFANYSFLDESHLILASQPLIFLERDMRKITENLTQTIFDPHQYNHPFLLYTFVLHQQGKPQRIKMIRMGSPTKESLGRKAVIIEEFKGLLKKLQIEKKNHLYVNKQRTWGKEGQRSFAVKQLESSFNNFFCICLPSDGAFYYQQMSYADQNNSEQFKEVFYELLVGKQGRGYYHFPQLWLDDREFCAGLKKVIDFVHLLYFSNASILTLAQKRYFIDHVYTQIIIYCLQKFNIQSVNISCRDGIDRAGCEQTKLLYYFQASLGIEEHTDSKIERQFLMHIPPYLAKNRPIVKERREYLYELMNNSYNLQVIEKIQQSSKVSPLLHLKPHFIKRT